MSAVAMGSSSLVIICSLALLAAVTAEICVSIRGGSLGGIPVEALKRVYPHGGIVPVPPVCSQPVGLAVTVCVKGGVPIVKILNYYQIQVITSRPFSIHVIVYCAALKGQSESDGLLRGTGHGFEIGAMDILVNNGRDILIPNQ